MATKRKSLIRQQIRDRILTLSGYTESSIHWENIGRNGQNVADKKFALGFSSTAEAGGRQKSPEGVKADSDCTILLMFKINPHNQTTTYDTALDGEEDVIKVVTNRSTPLYEGVSIRYNSSNQTVTETGEFIIVTIIFTISHYIPLA